MPADPISAAMGLADTLMDKWWPDAGEQKKRELRAFLTEFMQRSSIVQSEAKSEHFLTSSWRPITMLVFVFIIANNYIIAPYAAAIFGGQFEVALTIPPDMWTLLKIGLGGYVFGRSGEKMVKAYSDSKKGDNRG